MVRTKASPPMGTSPVSSTPSENERPPKAELDWRFWWVAGILLTVLMPFCLMFLTSVVQGRGGPPEYHFQRMLFRTVVGTIFFAIPIVTVFLPVVLRVVLVNQRRYAANGKSWASWRTLLMSLGLTILFWSASCTVFMIACGLLTQLGFRELGYMWSTPSVSNLAMSSVPALATFVYLYVRSIQTISGA